MVGEEVTVKLLMEYCKTTYVGGDKWDVDTMEERSLEEADVNDSNFIKVFEIMKIKAKAIKRKGNKYYDEEIRILEIDKHGDIINYLWSHP